MFFQLYSRNIPVAPARSSYFDAIADKLHALACGVPELEIRLIQSSCNN